MRQKAYFQLLEQLAMESAYLNHSSQETHFARLIQSGAPFDFLLIEEFLNKRKSELHTPFMLGQSYTWDYADNGHDSRFKQYNGAFILLDYYGKGDYSKRIDIMDETEEEAENITEKLRQGYGANPEVGAFQLGNAGGQSIVVEKLGYAGTRIDFSFIRMHNSVFQAQNKVKNQINVES